MKPLSPIRAAAALLLATATLVAHAAPLTLPPLTYTERTLANGLKVIAAEDHASPTVSVAALVTL